MKVLHFLLLILIMFSASPAHAGGDWYPVIVSSLHSEDTDYVLVVEPTTKTPLGFPSICKTFEVRGTYSWWHSWRGFPSWVNRQGHKKALVYLSHALKTGEVISFGFMGSGFEPIDPKDPCVVRSRALHLMENQGHLNKEKGVVSYFGRV